MLHEANKNIDQTLIYRSIKLTMMIRAFPKQIHLFELKTKRLWKIEYKKMY